MDMLIALVVVQVLMILLGKNILRSSKADKTCQGNSL